MKSKDVFFGCICFCIIVLFAGCEQTGTLHEVYKYPKELWGEWIRMDTGKNWYIASNYITNDNTGNDDDLTIVKQSANVIQVTGKSSEFYLYASRIPNGSFSGSITSIDDNGRSVFKGRTAHRLGGFDEVAKNVNNAAEQILVEWNGDNFYVNGAIPGDVYEIIGDGFSIPVYPNNSGEDIGTLAVTDGVNLITSIGPKSSSSWSSSTLDMMRLYTKTEYQLVITFINIGSADSRAAQYTLTLPEGLEITEATTGVLRTIEPGESGSIDITVTCNEIADEYEFKDIGIETVDRSGKTWEDSVSLKFNKARVTFRIFAEKQVQGVVIVPNVKTYHFTTSESQVAAIGKRIHNADIVVPKYSDDYLVVFSGATANTEAFFSLAVDALPNSDFTDDDFWKKYDDETLKELWGKYVNNTSEGKAERIDIQEPITAYLEKNDILYFKVTP